MRIHPDGIDELDARYRSDYRVEHVSVHHPRTTRVVVGFSADSAFELHVRDERAWVGPDPVLPEYLPDEDRLVG